MRSASTTNGIPSYTTSDLFLLDDYQLDYITGSNPREYSISGFNKVKVFYHNPDNSTLSYWTVDSANGFIAWFGRNSENSSSSARIPAIDGLNTGKVVAWALSEVTYAQNDTKKLFSYHTFKNVGYNTLQNGIPVTVPSGYEFFIKSVKTKSSIESYTTLLYWRFNRQGPRVSYRLGTRWVDIGILDSVTIKDDIRLQQKKCSITWEYDRCGKCRVNKILMDSTKQSTVAYNYKPFNNQFITINPFDFTATGKDPGYLIGTTTDLIDMNNDGYLDLVKKDTLPLLHVWYNNFDSTTNSLNFHYDTISLDDDSKLNNNAEMTDWDNDGDYDRVIYYYPDGRTLVAGVSKNTINENGQFQKLVKYAYPRTATKSYTVSDYGSTYVYCIPLDMNGDGFFDIIDFEKTFEITYLRDEQTVGNMFYTGYAPALKILAMHNTGIHKRKVNEEILDINGDGLPDYLRKYYGTTLHIRYNTGYQFSSLRTVETDPDSGYLSAYIWDKLGDEGLLTYSDYHDMNGDGLPDRINQKNKQFLQIWFNTGSGFMREDTLLTPNTYEVLPRQVSCNNNIETAIINIDINGDGLPDIVEKRDSLPLHVWLNPFLDAGILQSEAHSSGETIKYSYRTTHSNALNCFKSYKIQNTYPRYQTRSSNLPIRIPFTIERISINGTSYNELIYSDLFYDYTTNNATCFGKLNTLKNSVLKPNHQHGNVNTRVMMKPLLSQTGSHIVFQYPSLIDIPILEIHNLKGIVINKLALSTNSTSSYHSVNIVKPIPGIYFFTLKSHLKTITTQRIIVK